jgi:predicted kinase
MVEVTCDEEVVAQRLAERVKRGDSISDATIETYRRQRQQWEESPPPIPKGATVVRVDTSGDLPPDLDGAFTALRIEGLVRSRLDAQAE